MTAKQQTTLLADYILDFVPGEPSQNEGAGETAVRLLAKYRKAFDDIMHELGVPQPDYPAPIANAYRIAARMLDGSKGGEG